MNRYKLLTGALVASGATLIAAPAEAVNVVLEGKVTDSIFREENGATKPSWLNIGDKVSGSYKHNCPGGCEPISFSSSGPPFGDPSPNAGAQIFLNAGQGPGKNKSSLFETIPFAPTGSTSSNYNMVLQDSKQKPVQDWFTLGIKDKLGNLETINGQNGEDSSISFTKLENSEDFLGKLKIESGYQQFASTAESNWEIHVGITEIIPPTVDTELSLLLDASGSVLKDEFKAQKQAYVSAFNNLDPKGSIAANLIYWSGKDQQEVAVDWTEITDNTDSKAFATAIDNTTRPFDDLTAPGPAIDFAVNEFNNNWFDSNNQVIDVSGNGEQNVFDDAIDAATARDNALASGIDRINGLAIGDSNVESFYKDNIQGGQGSFTLTADSFKNPEFKDTVAEKIKRDIKVPESSSLPGLLAISVLGAGTVLVRKKA